MIEPTLEVLDELNLQISASALLPGFVAAAGYPTDVRPTPPADRRKPIRTIDLFAGAGGLTAGLHQGSNRFQPVVAVEADRAAAATYAENHSGTSVFAGRIEDWLDEGVVPEVDVVVGGPPCQGFSALGKQRVDDARNSLWEMYADVIVAARPRYFVVENVSQFLQSPQFHELSARTEPGGQLADYDISSHGVVNAVHFGSPQKRKRTVLIGSRRDLLRADLPEPTHLASTSWSSVRDAWAGLPNAVVETELPYRFTADGLRGPFKTSELHLTRTFSALSAARFRHIPSNGNRFDIPYELLSDCWRKHTTGSGDVMGRLNWDQPSVTIRTEFVKPEKGRYLHPVMHRSITLQEGARLQGFDDDYRWCGSKTEIAKQIGNAVPIALGSAIGRSISKLI